MDHARGFKDNLLSVSALTRDNNCHVVLTPTGGMVLELQSYDAAKVKGIVTLRDDLYRIDKTELSKPALKQ